MPETVTLRRPCPLCGRPEGERLHHQRFSLPAGSSLPEAYDVVACLECGFVFADTPAPQAAYDAYYRDCSIYEDPALASGTGLAPWERARFDELAALIAGHVGPESQVLDVGAANGGLLLALRRRGFSDLSALEPAPGCCRRLSADGFAAWQGTLLAPPVGVGGFDAVVLSHVLEHVRDLAAAREAVASLVAPGGLLYVEVPDAARYPAFYVVPDYYFDCEHINHFDPVSLDAMFLPAGFARVDGGCRDLTASATRRYPARYAIYRRTGGAAAPVLPAREAREGVVGYVRLSRERSGLGVLDAYAASQEPVVVWGAGSYALRLMGDSPLARCRVTAFLDRDAKKQGTRLGAAPVLAPDALPGLGHAGPVLVASALHAEAIVEELAAMGLDNPVVVLG